MLHVVAPWVDAYVPTAQGKQLYCPAVGVYVPVAQALQTVRPDAVPYMPEGHRTGGALFTGQADPIGQLTHAVDSATVEYVPIGQLTHTLSVWLVHCIMTYDPDAHTAALHGTIASVAFMVYPGFTTPIRRLLNVRPSLSP